LGAVQSGPMVHACNRPLPGVKVSNHAGVFTQSLGGANSLRRLVSDRDEFFVHVHAMPRLGSPAVAHLYPLGRYIVCPLLPKTRSG
jgi:hypothetical protein